MIKRVSDRFFKWYCHPSYYPDIKGDLEEMYRENLKNQVRFPQIRHAMEVLMLFRPSLIRTFSQSSSNEIAMYKNYFRIGVRNLLKHKAFTTINVIGLALGLTAFLLIDQYIRFERSYDQYFSSSSQIYRLTSDQITDGVIQTRDAMSFHPSGKALKEEFPGVLDYTTTYKMNNLVIRHNDQLWNERSIVAADSNYFKLFDYQVLAGDPVTMLNDPNSIVLTKSKAQVFFGDENPLGKQLYVLGRFERPFQVTGLMEDVPENTHYKYDMLISLNTLSDRGDWGGWNGFNYYTYLLIDSKADITGMRAQLPELSRKFIGEETSLYFNLQPMEDIHLYSNFTYEPEIHGSARAVNFMVIISIFVLVIAWVNYVNLSTARAADRAKEVGMRKVIGAHRRQLIIQFLFESVLVNFMAAVLAFLLSDLLLPFFNQLVGKEVISHVWNSPSYLITLLIFFLVGSIVSGFYPALVLSRYKPSVVLRGKFRNSSGGVFLRKSLVVIQFVTSIVLISSTFIINRQMNYMLSQDMGLDIDYVLGFRNPSYSSGEEEMMDQKLKSFKQELLSHNAIINVGMTTSMPGGGSSDISSNTGRIRIVGMTDPIEGTTYVQWNDEDYLETVGMNLLYGRDLEHSRVQDTASVIVNESFLKKMGIADPESVLNQKIQFGTEPENDKFNIIGVVKDYNRSSLKFLVEPTLYFLDESPRNTMVKLTQANYQDGLMHMQEVWGRFFPNAPLNYEFLDERFERLYNEDVKFGRIFATFSIMAVLIAVLGLFGLSSFLAMQRSKEVGVRKVLGASISGIIVTSFREFLILILVSGCLGLPIVYLGMEEWLGNFANRISFPWLLSVVSVMIVLLFTLFTVGYQTYKVAVMDPSKTLRYE